MMASGERRVQGEQGVTEGSAALSCGPLMVTCRRRPCLDFNAQGQSSMMNCGASIGGGGGGGGQWE